MVKSESEAKSCEQNVKAKNDINGIIFARDLVIQ